VQKKRMTKPSTLRVFLGAMIVLSLTACAGVNAGGGGAESSPTKISTKISGDPVTLTLAYTDDPPTEALIAGFTDLHPNVTIKGQQTPFSDYVKSIKLSMSSDNPPDIAEYNPGAMRSLVPAGLVLNLDAYTDAYGWDKAFPPASLQVLSSDKSAKKYGTGSLYAVPGALSVLGVFYNKDLLKQAGVTSLPTTFDEFDGDLKKIKNAGIRPFSVGGLEVGGFQVWNSLINVLGDVKDYRNWVYGESGSTIETQGAKDATAKLVEWVSKGYIPSAVNATSDSDAQAKFANGKSAFLITGNWAAAAIEKQMGDNVGFLLMPPVSAGAPSIAAGGSVAFLISSKTEHPDVAAAFLDYMSSPEAAQIQFEGGFMPVNTKADIGTEGLRGEIAKGFGQVIDGDGIVPFADYASPAMIDKLISGFQGVTSGHMKEDDFGASLQTEWAEYHA
jgi:ABC-type glycerol-3-phosphate transport system substrate-binding protein